MPGTHKKGTNDADGDGAKGGSRPEKLTDLVVSAPETKVDKRGDPHARIDQLEALMRANGWTVD